MAESILLNADPELATERVPRAAEAEEQFLVVVCEEAVDWESPQLLPSLVNTVLKPTEASAEPFEDRVLRFAGAWGYLGLQETFLTPSRRQVGERWAHWLRQMQLLSAAYKVNDWLSSTHLGLVARQITWESEHRISVELPVPVGCPGKVITVDVDAAKSKYDAAQPEDALAQMARFIITYLLGTESPTMTAHIMWGAGKKPLSFRYKPQSLKDALWHAMLLDITGATRLQTCLNCGQVFNATANRSNKKHCPNSNCKDEWKRKPYYQVRELKAQGVTVEEIAVRLGKDPAWVTKALDAPPSWFQKPARKNTLSSPNLPDKKG